MSLPLKTRHEGKQSRSWDFLTWTIELVFRQPVSVPLGEGVQPKKWDAQVEPQVHADFLCHMQAYWLIKPPKI